jgi:RNA recognition motif-containing protein
MLSLSGSKAMQKGAAHRSCGPVQRNERTRMNKTLYVGNLGYTVNADDLKDLFGQVGAVLDAKVIYDRYTNNSRGFGFVEMASEEEAQGAINKLNGQELAGRQIRVNEARPRERNRRPSRRDRW